MKAIGVRNPAYTYQATAISADCTKVALMGLMDFFIYDVPANLRYDPTLICWGDLTKRYGPQPRSAVELEKGRDRKQGVLSYYMGTLTNDVLAIASVDTYVDVRNARTGERIAHLTLPSENQCRAITFSPDGQNLAVGLSQGEIIVYRAGLVSDFGGEPIHLNQNNMPLTTMVFSHDSLLMVACTKDNFVRVYRVDNLTAGAFEEYIKPSEYGKPPKPANISDISLYLPRKNFLMSVSAIHIHCTLSPKTNPPIRPSLQRLLHQGRSRATLSAISMMERNCEWHVIQRQRTYWRRQS